MTIRRPSIRFAAALAGMLLATASAAHAQETLRSDCTAIGPCPARWSQAVVQSTADRTEDMRATGSRRLLGAGVGFVVGAGATYFVLNSGGSTAPCDRDANQDAMSSGECLGLYALGGLVGAGLGVLVGGAFHTSSLETAPARRFHMQWLPGRPLKTSWTLPL